MTRNFTVGFTTTARARLLRRIALVLVALMAPFLAGCQGRESYGSAVPYRPGYAPPAPIVMPPGAPHISQQFAPQRGDTSFAGHNGLDFYGRRGTPVLAAAPGTVIRAFREPMYGRRVHIDHGVDVDGKRVITRYFHLETIDVKEGDVVRRGQKIGSMGDSGLLGLAVHLHFEVSRGRSDARSDYVDPQAMWVDGPGRVTCFDPGRDYPDRPIRMTVPLPCRKPAAGAATEGG